MSLLPPNSTKFERDVEVSIKYGIDLSFLFGFKFENDDPRLRLALAWEYSLAQINIDDFAERVLKGLEFHRLRGTPAALRNALSWYGFDDIIIEEEPPGEHFAEFQLGITEIPNGFVPDPYNYGCCLCSSAAFKIKSYVQQIVRREMPVF
jgi:P2-related tail formation protein